jgi:hypothetical protein
MRNAGKFLAAALFTAGFVSSAHAQSWYPIGHDCAPVQGMTWAVPDGARISQLVAISTRGEAVIPQDVLLQDAKDGRMHVCTQYDAFGERKVTAVLVPPVVRASQ